MLCNLTDIVGYLSLTHTRTHSHEYTFFMLCFVFDFLSSSVLLYCYTVLLLYCYFMIISVFHFLHILAFQTPTDVPLPAWPPSSPHIPGEYFIAKGGSSTDVH